MEDRLSTSSLIEMGRRFEREEVLQEIAVWYSDPSDPVCQGLLAKVKARGGPKVLKHVPIDLPPEGGEIPLFKFLRVIVEAHNALVDAMNELRAK